MYSDRKQRSSCSGWRERGFAVAENRFTMQHEETLGDDGYVYCLDCNDDFTGVSVKTIQMVHFPCIPLIVCKLYLTKAV